MPTTSHPHFWLLLRDLWVTIQLVIAFQETPSDGHLPPQILFESPLL